MLYVPPAKCFAPAQNSFWVRRCIEVPQASDVPYREWAVSEGEVSLKGVAWADVLRR
jgi:hypothetical protein